jgi:hypothetical protein
MRRTPRKVVYPLLLAPQRHHFVIAAPPAGEPARSAYEAGRRSAASEGATCPRPDMTREERAAFILGVMAARDGDDLRAPLRWRLELCFLALQAASMEVDRRAEGGVAKALRAAPLVPVLLVATELKAKLERTRARELGLTAETAPRESWSSCLSGLLGVLGQQGIWRLIYEVQPAPWPRVLAASMVSEFERRREWSRALCAGPARSI